MGIFDGFGPMLDIASAFAGNLFAEEQQEDSQTFNASQAAENRKFQDEQAIRQMQFQERMASTQYQRMRKDLEAAGYNPLLAVAHGAGAAPAGAAASGSVAQSGMASPNSRQLSAGMTHASQIAVNQALEEKTRAEADRARAEADNIREQTPTHGVQRDQMRQNIELMKQQIGESAVRIEKIWAETTNIHAATEKIKVEIPKIKTEIEHLRALIKQTGALTGLTEAQSAEVRQRISANLPAAEEALLRVQSKLQGLHIPQQEQTAHAADSFVGTLGGYLRQLTSSLNGLLVGIPTGRSRR